MAVRSNSESLAPSSPLQTPQRPIDVCRACPYAKGWVVKVCTYPTQENPRGCHCPIESKARFGQCPAGAF